MNLLKTLAIAAAGLVLSLGAAHAEGQKTAKDISFSFEWPFGHFDREQLQRGYKVYKEVCSNCHSMQYMSFRNLSQQGGPEFSDEQVKALAAGYHGARTARTTTATCSSARACRPTTSPRRSPNEQAARAANGGAYPPDLSLITKFASRLVRHHQPADQRHRRPAVCLLGADRLHAGRAAHRGTQEGAARGQVPTIRTSPTATGSACRLRCRTMR